MSFNSYQQISPEMQSAMSQIADSRIAAKSNVTIWRDPTRKQYFIANDPHSTQPDFGIPITKPEALPGIERTRKDMGKAATSLQGGSASMSATELDNLRYDVFTNEAVNDAVMFYDSMDALRKQYHQTGDAARFIGGGTITAQSYPALSNVMVDQTVLDLISRDFIILDAVTRKSWDKLVYTFDNRTPFRNQGDLGELDMSPARSVSYARDSISLKKAQGHVSVSIWASLAIRDHDIESDNTSIIDADFERIFSTDVATTITGFADQNTGGAYDVIGSGAFHSTTNPSARFDADSLSIKTAGGRGDILGMNTATYRALIQNTWMRLSGNPTLALGQTINNVDSFSTTHQLLPGKTIYVDELFADDKIAYYDKRAVVFLEGPTSMRNIELNYGQVKDTVNDRWYGSGIKVSSWGVEENNIHS